MTLPPSLVSLDIDRTDFRSNEVAKIERACLERERFFRWLRRKEVKQADGIASVRKARSSQ
jgi:hypothetical protein